MTGGADRPVEAELVELQALELERLGVAVELAGADHELGHEPGEAGVAGREVLAGVLEVGAQVAARRGG